MGFFKLVEETLNKGFGVVNEAVAKTVDGLGEATKGWGEKADAWLADDRKFDHAKEEAADWFAKASDATDNITEDIKDFVTEAKQKIDEAYTRLREEAEEKAAKAAAEAEAEAAAEAAAEDLLRDVENLGETDVTDDIDVVIVAATMEDGEIVITEDQFDKLLAQAKVAELREKAKKLGVKNVSKLNKADLKKAIKKAKKK